MPPEWLDTTSAPPGGKVVQAAHLGAVVALDQRPDQAHHALGEARIPLGDLRRLDIVDIVGLTGPPRKIKTCSSFDGTQLGALPVAIRRRYRAFTITGVSEEASSTEAEVLVEQRDRILIITINRPKAKNAVNAAVSQGLADAMDRLDDDAGLSVGGADRCGRLVLRRDGPQGLRPRRERDRRGPRHGLHRASARQAADRRRRGLRAGRRDANSRWPPT